MRVLGLLLFVALAYAKHEAYEGYSLYQVSAQTVEQIPLIQELETSLELDVWSDAIPGRPGQVLVAGEKKMFFEAGLKVLGAEFEVQAENIKEFLDLEDKLLETATKKPFSQDSKATDLSFEHIYTYEEVDAFLEALAAAYPETVTLVNAGKSFEGRDIKYIKLSTTNFEDSSKPVIYIQSLLHAREWVTLPATLYAIKRLVIDVTEQDLIQDIDWVILPIANPDGFVFTREERFWRKNRATGYMAADFCLGVDLNRNFDVHWSSASSSFVCLETFHGRGAFSEPETAIIRDIFEEHKDRMELFLDIHSFGSMILYGYGNGTLPSNGLFLHLLGVQMAHAIDAVKLDYNSNYIVGNTALILYDASGTASDYGTHIGVPFSYTYELPGFRFGLGTALGFLVDPDFIEQAGFETWEGIKAGARYARNSYSARTGRK